MTRRHGCFDDLLLSGIVTLTLYFGFGLLPSSDGGEQSSTFDLPFVEITAAEYALHEDDSFALEIAAGQQTTRQKTATSKGASETRPMASASTSNSTHEPKPDVGTVSANTPTAATTSREPEPSDPSPEPAPVSYFPLQVPLDLNGVYLGEIQADVSFDGQAKLPKEELLRLLRPRLNEDFMIGLESLLAADAEEKITLAALLELGLDGSFDQSNLIMKLNVAGNAFGVQSISLQNKIAQSPDGAHTPANFSGGFNMALRPSYTHTDAAGTDGFEPLRADLQAFTNIGGFDGWTLLLDADYDDSRSEPIKRRDLTLVRDNFENATRLRVGDYRSQSLSLFQGSSELLGVSYTRNYREIQPFTNLRPSGRSSFTLDRRSRVIVEVNGAVVFDDFLDAGSFDVEDFPFSFGANEARVFVDDGTGVREFSAFDSYVENELLNPGLDRFGVNLGLLSNGFLSDDRYTDDLAFTGYYQRGISQNLTASTNFELDPDTAQVTGGMVTGSRFGVVAIETALSWDEAADYGYATVINYTSPRTVRPASSQGASWTSEFSAQALFRNRDFRSVSSQFNGQETRLDLRYNLRRGRLGLDASVSHSVIDREERNSVQGGANWGFGSINLGARLQHRWGDSRQEQTRFLVSLTKRLGRSQRLRARADTQAFREASWTRTSYRNLGDWDGRARLTDNSGAYAGEVEAGYVGNRYEGRLRHVSSIDESSVRTSRTEGIVSFGAGFADNQFGFGRPFDSGFIIADRHKTLQDRTISFSEGLIGEIAKSDGFGAPFIPLRSGYRRVGYEIDVDDLPPGYDLGAGEVEVFSGFRTGYKLTVGSGQANTVITRLVTPAGEPVSLMSGRLVQADGQGEPNSFFTNRTGRMVVERVAPGRYDIILSPAETKVGTLVVPEDAQGLGRIDSIEIQE